MSTYGIMILNEPDLKMTADPEQETKETELRPGWGGMGEIECESLYPELDLLSGYFD